MKIEKLLEQYKEQYIEDLISIAKIDSVFDEKTITTGKPFGSGVALCFEQMIKIAQRDGFKVTNYDGYVLEIEYGQGSESIAVLGHLDVVPVGDLKAWQHHPFTPTIIDNKMYGRGVADDKGPTLAAYYALLLLVKQGFVPNKRIRFILGGAEETSWKCMDHYFDTLKMEQPTFGFTPDADFPLISAEKGLLTLNITGHGITNDNTINIKSITGGNAYNSVCDECQVLIDKDGFKLLDYPENTQIKELNDDVLLTFIGKSAHGMQPERGINAIDLAFASLSKIKDKVDSKLKGFIEMYMNHFYEDYYGINLNINENHHFMGSTSNNIGMIKINADEFYLGINPRFVHPQTTESVMNSLVDTLGNYQLKVSIEKESKMIYLDENNPYLKTLKKAYSMYRDDEFIPLATGGGTYAKALDNGVAFGPFFSTDTPQYHTSKEELNLDSIYQAILIYAQTLKELAFEDNLK